MFEVTVKDGECNQCKGYPYPIPPRNVSSELEEVNFDLKSSLNAVQISSKTNILEMKLKNESIIACSMYFHSMKEVPEENLSWIERLDKSKHVIIFCHGGSSWRNQMLIMNLAAKLADESKCHTLRFDFTGNGHSTGTWNTSNYNGELRDLHNIVKFVRQRLQCRVSCIIGHSKGSIAALTYALEGYKIPCVVNLSGQFMTPRSLDQVITERFTDKQKESLMEYGNIVLPSEGRRDRIITIEDLQQKAKMDMNKLSNLETWVLTLHGDKDEKVSMFDAYRFAAIIPNHEVHFVKGADHNFCGIRNIRVMSSMIANFIQRHDNGDDE